MNPRGSFTEIMGLINSKLPIPLPLSFACKDSHTLQLKKRIPLTRDIEVEVEHVDDSIVYLNMKSGTIEKALEIAKRFASLQCFAMVETRNNRIILHLDRNPKFAKILKRITLQDISFTDNSAVVKFTPNI